MAKSRKDRWRAEEKEKVAAQRIWPVWTRTIGAMIEAGAIVRFACPACKRLYDVDLEAIATMRGRAWSLIGRGARCKASKCRERGMFVASAREDAAFTCLAGDMPRWLIGARPIDHEPPPEGPRRGAALPKGGGLAEAESCGGHGPATPVSIPRTGIQYTPSRLRKRVHHLRKS